MDDKLGDHGDLEKSNTSLPHEHTGADELPIIDPKEEAKLVRKLDAFIIPITMLLYLFRYVYPRCLKSHSLN